MIQIRQALLILNNKNVNKRKNLVTPLKLKGKKHDKKIMALREGSGGEIPSSVRKKPRPIYLTPPLRTFCGCLFFVADSKFSIAINFIITELPSVSIESSN